MCECVHVRACVCVGVFVWGEGWWWNNVNTLEWSAGHQAGRGRSPMDTSYASDSTFNSI